MLLRQAGYRTAIAGKVGFVVKPNSGGKPIYPLLILISGEGPGQTNYKTIKNKSMVAYAGKYPHSSRSYGAFGRDFILESVKSEKPYCLSISFKAPHKPDEPDPAFNHVYKGKTFQNPVILVGNTVSTSLHRAVWGGSMNGLSVGGTATVMMKPWPSTISSSMALMWLWV